LINDTLNHIDKSEKDVISQLSDLLDQAKRAATTATLCIFDRIHSSLSADVAAITAKLTHSALPAKVPTICSDNADVIDFNKVVPTTLLFLGFDLYFDALDFRIKALDGSYRATLPHAGFPNQYTYALPLVDSSGHFLIKGDTDRAIDVFQRDVNSATPLYSIAITPKLLPTCGLISIGPVQSHIQISNYQKLYGDDQYGSSNVIMQFTEQDDFVNNSATFSFDALLTEDYFGNTDQTITKFTNYGLVLATRPSQDYVLYGYSIQPPSAGVPPTTDLSQIRKSYSRYHRNGVDVESFVGDPGGFVTGITIRNLNTNYAPAVTVEVYLNPNLRFVYKQASNCQQL
jgi:hypothetical protein